MEFSLKNISIAITIISALIGIIYKLVPRSSDRLKKDLELLKLAKEVEVNHLPLERHINHRIHEDYVKKNLSIKERADIYFGQISFAILLMASFLSIIGLVISYLLKVFSWITVDSAENVFIGFLIFGIFGGIVGGQAEAKEIITDKKKEMKERINSIVEEDENALSTEEKSIIVQP